MKALHNLTRKNGRSQKRTTLPGLKVEVDMAANARAGGQVHVGDNIPFFHPRPSDTRM